jgi:hypothetical protein
MGWNPISSLANTISNVTGKLGTLANNQIVSTIGSLLPPKYNAIFQVGRIGLPIVSEISNKIAKATEINMPSTDPIIGMLRNPQKIISNNPLLKVFRPEIPQVGNQEISKIMRPTGIGRSGIGMIDVPSKERTERMIESARKQGYKG